MPNKETHNHLVQVFIKNKLAIQSYVSLISVCDLNLIKEFLTSIKGKKNEFMNSLFLEKRFFSEEIATSYVLDNDLIEPWFIFNLEDLNNCEQLLKCIIEAEEKAVLDLKFVSSLDLSAFGQVRDLFQMHLFQIQKIISKLKGTL